MIDATGAVTFEMRPFSELEGWTPTKVFNERIQYKAVATGARRPSLANQRVSARDPR